MKSLIGAAVLAAATLAFSSCTREPSYGPLGPTSWRIARGFSQSTDGSRVDTMRFSYIVSRGRAPKIRQINITGVDRNSGQFNQAEELYGYIENNDTLQATHATYETETIRGSKQKVVTRFHSGFYQGDIPVTGSSVFPLPGGTSVSIGRTYTYNTRLVGSTARRSTLRATDYQRTADDLGNILPFRITDTYNIPASSYKSYSGGVFRPDTVLLTRVYSPGTPTESRESFTVRNFYDANGNCIKRSRFDRSGTEYIEFEADFDLTKPSVERFYPVFDAFRLNYDYVVEGFDRNPNLLTRLRLYSEFDPTGVYVQNSSNLNQTITLTWGAFSNGLPASLMQKVENLVAPSKNREVNITFTHENTEF